MWSSDRNKIQYFNMILKRIVKSKFQKFGQDTIILSTFETFCFFSEFNSSFNLHSFLEGNNFYKCCRTCF